MFQVDIDNRHDVEAVDLKLSSPDDPEAKYHFTMKTGEKFLVFEKCGVICAEKKKHFHNWTTISDFKVNPHKNMRKHANACDFCPY